MRGSIPFPQSKNLIASIKKIIKKILIFFEKTLDKCNQVWYNKGTKEMEVLTMERVIRICEMTGRVTVVAEGLNTEEAMAMVVELSKNGDFAMYRRVVSK